MASNQGRVYFSLSGYHFHPDDITKLIGIEPTRVDASGAGSGMDKPMISTWEVSTDTVTDNVNTYELADLIMKIIEPQKDKILAAIESHNLSPRLVIALTLSIDKDEEAPEVGFGARILRQLGEFGAFVNVEYKLAERI